MNFFYRKYSEMTFLSLELERENLIRQYIGEVHKPLSYKRHLDTLTIAINDRTILVVHDTLFAFKQEAFVKNYFYEEEKAYTDQYCYDFFRNGNKNQKPEGLRFEVWCDKVEQCTLDACIATSIKNIKFKEEYFKQ